MVSGKEWIEEWKRSVRRRRTLSNRVRRREEEEEESASCASLFTLFSLFSLFSPSSFTVGCFILCLLHRLKYLKSLVSLKSLKSSVCSLEQLFHSLSFQIESCSKSCSWLVFATSACVSSFSLSLTCEVSNIRSLFPVLSSVHLFYKGMWYSDDLSNLNIKLLWQRMIIPWSCCSQLKPSFTPWIRSSQQNLEQNLEQNRTEQNYERLFIILSIWLLLWCLFAKDGGCSFRLFMKRETCHEQRITWEVGLLPVKKEEEILVTSLPSSLSSAGICYVSAILLLVLLYFFSPPSCYFSDINITTKADTDIGWSGKNQWRRSTPFFLHVNRTIVMRRLCL